MTYWTLLAIAGFLTWLSLRNYNIIFSFAGSLGWLAVWAYHQNHPPTNIVQGEWLYELLYYVYIIMSIATMLIYFRNRGRVPMEARTAKEKAQYDAEYNEYSQPQMNGNEEYRRRVRGALRRRN